MNEMLQKAYDDGFLAGQKAMVEKIKTLKKPPIMRSIPCPDKQIGCSVYHAEQVEPEENKIIDDILSSLEDTLS